MKIEFSIPNDIWEHLEGVTRRINRKLHFDLKRMKKMETRNKKESSPHVESDNFVAIIISLMIDLYAKFKNFKILK